ncbi:MAG: glycosyltransferase [Thermoleophilia bacterium]|nr:glycosyltransferase [Thermoleophilia bacterium]
MRVLLADPPAFTPAYDHALAAALAAAGAEVELVTARFRFGEAPRPDGYRRTELFYGLSGRVFRRSRLRLPLKLAEHAVGLARLAGRAADVTHFQWLPVPQLDDLLLRRRHPSVLTAHDVLPRRTARRRARRGPRLGRLAAGGVPRERARGALVALGVPAARLRVIPHPVFPADVTPADDGRTVLALGVIRPYKQLEHAVEAARRADARLLVAGDPAMPLRRPAGDGVEWRLGYLPEDELDRALADSTLAVFPYRAELDQSGALLRALGAGVPAVVYDVAGLPEPVRAFGAGRVVPADDVGALAGAVRELLDDPDALAAAREGARRARAALTWDASARAHLELYEELRG